MTLLVTVAWPTLVLAWAVPRRPLRVVALRPSPVVVPPGGRPVRRLSPRVDAGLGAIGRAVRSRARRPADPAADARLGGWLVVALAGAALWWPLLVAVPALGYGLPALRARRRGRAEAERVVVELPQVIDLLGIAVGSGLTGLAAVAVVSERRAGPVGAALASARRSVELGSHPDEAFGRVVADLGEPVRPLVAALLASIRDGTELGSALARLGHDARLIRRRRAEEAARKVPVRLLFPLVLCALPAFALLTIVPLLVAAIGSLRT